MSYQKFVQDTYNEIESDIKDSIKLGTHGDGDDMLCHLIYHHLRYGSIRWGASKYDYIFDNSSYVVNPKLSKYNSRALLALGALAHDIEDYMMNI